MSAGSFVLLTKADLNIGKGLIDLDSGTFVAVLLDETYTPANTTHETWADMSAAELATGGGYTAGGMVLTQTWQQVGAEVFFDANDAIWNGTIEAKYVAVIQRAGGSLTSTDKVLGYVDLNTASASAVLTSQSADFGASWHANGLFKSSLAA